MHVWRFLNERESGLFRVYMWLGTDHQSWMTESADSCRRIPQMSPITCVKPQISFCHMFGQYCPGVLYELQQGLNYCKSIHNMEEELPFLIGEVDWEDFCIGLHCIVFIGFCGM